MIFLCTQPYYRPTLGLPDWPYVAEESKLHCHNKFLPLSDWRCILPGFGGGVSLSIMSIITSMFTWCVSFIIIKWCSFVCWVISWWTLIVIVASSSSWGRGEALKQSDHWKAAPCPKRFFTNEHFKQTGLLISSVQLTLR